MAGWAHNANSGRTVSRIVRQPYCKAGFWVRGVIQVTIGFAGCSGSLPRVIRWAAWTWSAPTVSAPDRASSNRYSETIEPIIGHMKSEGHLGRCYLKGREGDAINVILTAVGHNLRRVLAWLRDLLVSILIALWRSAAGLPAVKQAS